jgi:hypothetical protein
MSVYTQVNDIILTSERLKVILFCSKYKGLSASLSPLQGNFSISKEFFPNCILRNTFFKTSMHEPTDLVKSSISYFSTSLDTSNLKEFLKAY